MVIVECGVLLLFVFRGGSVVDLRQGELWVRPFVRKKMRETARAHGKQRQDRISMRTER